MATKKRNSRKHLPLIREDHPPEYKGYPFITLIKYRNNHFLTIVDNIDDKKIKAFVLDLCGPEDVEERHIIDVAADWYHHNSSNYPLSFELSKKGLSGIFGKIYKNYPIEFVTRVIGPLPKFEMNNNISVKRRRRKGVPNGVIINKKNNIL